MERCPNSELTLHLSGHFSAFSSRHVNHRSKPLHPMATDIEAQGKAKILGRISCLLYLDVELRCQCHKGALTELFRFNR